MEDLEIETPYKVLQVVLLSGSGKTFNVRGCDLEAQIITGMSSIVRGLSV